MEPQTHSAAHSISSFHYQTARNNIHPTDILSVTASDLFKIIPQNVNEALYEPASPQTKCASDERCAGCRSPKNIQFHNVLIVLAIPKRPQVVQKALDTSGHHNCGNGVHSGTLAGKPPASRQHPLFEDNPTKDQADRLHPRTRRYSGGRCL